MVLAILNTTTIVMPSMPFVKWTEPNYLAPESLLNMLAHVIVRDTMIVLAMIAMIVTTAVGTAVIVIVIGTGVDPGHPRLVDRLGPLDIA